MVPTAGSYERSQHRCLLFPRFGWSSHHALVGERDHGNGGASHPMTDSNAAHSPHPNQVTGRQGSPSIPGGR